MTIFAVVEDIVVTFFICVQSDNAVCVSFAVCALDYSVVAVTGVAVAGFVAVASISAVCKSVITAFVSPFHFYAICVSGAVRSLNDSVVAETYAGTCRVAVTVLTVLRAFIAVFISTLSNGTAVLGRIFVAESAVARIFSHPCFARFTGCLLYFSVAACSAFREAVTVGVAVSRSFSGIVSVVIASVTHFVSACSYDAAVLSCVFIAECVTIAVFTLDFSVAAVAAFIVAGACCIAFFITSVFGTVVALFVSAFKYDTVCVTFTVFTLNDSVVADKLCSTAAVAFSVAAVLSSVITFFVYSIQFDAVVVAGAVFTVNDSVAAFR